MKIFACNQLIRGSNNFRLRMGKRKIFSANFIVEQIWRQFWSVIWGSETKLDTQKKGILRVFPIQISTQNGKMKNLLWENLVIEQIWW
jgi:hypothetical protein